MANPLPRVVRSTGKFALLWSGNRSVDRQFFGVSNWYWPWDATRENPPAGTYSLNRYCDTNNSSPNKSVSWKVVQAGGRGTFAWDDMDAWVNAHYANGTGLLVELGKAPAWATSDGSSTKAPVDMADFAAWVTAAGTRYAGKVRNWFVRNEPTFSGTTSEWVDTAAKYAEMTRIASQILKSIDPLNKVIGPEASGNTPLAWSSYITPALAASATGYNAGFGTGAGTTMKDWIDAVSFHPYIPWPDNDDGIGWDQIWSSYQTSISLSAAQAPGRPMWATEYMAIHLGAGASGGAVTGDLELRALWRQVAYAIGAGVERFVWFGWGVGAGVWTRQDAVGVAARAWWQSMFDFCTAVPIVQLRLYEGNEVGLIRADGAEFRY